MWQRDWDRMAEYDEDNEHVWVVPPNDWTVKVEPYSASPDWEVITFTHKFFGEREFVVEKVKENQNV